MNPLVVILLFFIIPVIALIILKYIANLLPVIKVVLPGWLNPFGGDVVLLELDLGASIKAAIDSLAETFGNLLSSILQTLASPFTWLRDTINLAVQNEALATVGAITVSSLIIFAGIYLVWRYSPWTS